MPQAYFLISRFHYWRGEFSDSYSYASLGIVNCFDNFNSSEPSLDSFDEYDGIHDLLLVKALCGFELKLEQEYRDIFNDEKVLIFLK